MPDFLLEIQTEELPAGYVAPALAALEQAFRSAIDGGRLSVGAIRTTCTPRRLTLHAADLPEAQADHTREARGPAVRIAFDEAGNPTKAGIGFARSQGLEPTQLIRREDNGNEYTFAVVQVQGERTADLLSGVLPGIIAGLPWPKSMHWRGKAFTFARPIRGLMAILGGEVVALETAGVASGRTTPGHPFEAPDPIEIPSADFEAYTDALRAARVLVDRAERRAAIVAGMKPVLDADDPDFAYGDLLDEVTDLVEWPLVLRGHFDEAYLELPAPVVVAAMTGHQRYFPVHDADGALTSAFVVVANRSADDDGTILAGNERVLVGRLDDARFFWHEDRKRPLADRVPALAKVVYQEDLGSVLDKVGRVKAVAEALCDRIGVDDAVREAVLRAVHLSKADLVTEMVGEFPELQGTIGRAYALADGEPLAVADAIAEHYQPWGEKDEPPSTEAGAIAALADKFDSLAACLSAGVKVTGSADPYGLRRQALGIIRIVRARKYGLSLSQAFKVALDRLPEAVRNMRFAFELMDFMRDRLVNSELRPSIEVALKGSRIPRMRLVLALLDYSPYESDTEDPERPEFRFDDLVDFDKRLEDLAGLAEHQHTVWDALIEVVERCYKIARDADLPESIDESLLTEPAEQALYSAFRAGAQAVREAVERGDYADASRLYVDAFAEPVHAFFDEVFVNVDDPALRANRMLLCRLIHRLYARNIASLELVPGT